MNVEKRFEIAKNNIANDESKYEIVQNYSGHSQIRRSNFIECNRIGKNIAACNRFTTYR